MAKKKAALTAKTMKYLRDRGTEAQPVYVDKVEQPFNIHTKVTKDLYGIFDILALVRSEVYQLIGIQVTSRTNMSARLKKIVAAPEAQAWLDAGCKIELWGWDQPRGPRTAWRLKTEFITASQLGATQ